jgi:hypothetical protein
VLVISANIHRRHMGKGQRAMAVAMIYPEPERGRGKKDPAKGVKVTSYSYIQHARTILEYAPDVAPNVLSGAASLQEAYEEARRRKAAAENEESSMDRLRRLAPDLAELARNHPRRGAVGKVGAIIRQNRFRGEPVFWPQKT